MSRYRRAGRSDEYDDMSIVLQTKRSFDELLGPPEVEIPTREYSQRSTGSGIPDGSIFDPTSEAPVGETLDKFFLRLSKAAKQAWDIWTNEDQEMLLSNGTTIKPLNKSIKDAMLTTEESNFLTRIERLYAIEKTLLQREEESFVRRLITESARLTSPGGSGEIPDSSRFYIEESYEKDHIGQIFFKKEKKDRCKGKATIRFNPVIQISNVEQVTGTPSHAERLEYLNMSAYQTEKWRKTNRSETDNYIPNVTPSDDPDYIPPLSISSRNFVIYPPASRPFNIVFKVCVSKRDKKYYKIYPDRSKKDYVSLSSIIYMLKKQGKVFEEVTIDETKYNDRLVPNCRFEIDLRVTYSDNMTPDPVNYRKIDPESKLGMKLLQMLNEQSYLFKEYYWDHQEEVDGELVNTKKVAVGFTVPKPGDNKGKRVYWVYLNEDKRTIGKPAFLRGRWIPPQYTYKPLRYYNQDAPSYLKKEAPFLATVRVSDSYYYYDKKLDKQVSFKEVKENFFKVLEDKGYIFVKEVAESDYSNIRLFHFVHSLAQTIEQRKLIFLTLTEGLT